MAGGASGGPADEVVRPKDEFDGVLLVNGSAQLVAAFAEYDLVDEYRLMVFPLVLGTGKRLFGELGASIPMKLVDSMAVGDGVMVLTYRRQKLE